MIKKVQKLVQKINYTKFGQILFSKSLYILIPISFFLILFTKKPNLIRPISLLVKFQPHLSLPIISLMIFLCMTIRKKDLSKFFISFLIISLFALSLSGIWVNTQTENYMLAGLLPRSDANFQYAGALKLLDFGELNGTTSRRPFFGEFLALLLGLTQHNLQLTLAIMVFLASLSALYSTFEVKNLTNNISAVLYLLLIYLYYSKFVGTTMTENLGYIFGLLSFTMFLKGVRFFKDDKTKSLYFFLLGTFLFSLGQNARPGAIFTIPLFLIFSAWFWRDNHKIKWNVVLLTFLAALLPFLINQVHFMLNGLQSSMPMANMGYGLYGFIKGGKGWNQIIFDYPELTNMPGKEQNAFIFRHIFREVLNNPSNIIEGFKYQFSSLFAIEGENSLFSFILIDNPQINTLFSYFIYFLCIVGLFNIITKIKTRLNILILLAVVGFVISLPFSPAYQTMFMRVYAVSIPFLCFIPSYGVDYFLSSKIGKKIFKIKSVNNNFRSENFAVFFSLLIICAPFILNLLHTEKPIMKTKCPPNLESTVVYYHPNSSINIVKDDLIILDCAPNIHQSKFRSNVHNICCEDDIKFFVSLSAPITLFTSIDYYSGKKHDIIADTDSLPKEKKWLQMCGIVKDIYDNPANDGFFYPEMIYSIE